MTIRRFSINDDLAVFDKLWGWSPSSFSFMRGELYDPENFDLVPKKHYVERQIKLKEKQLDELKQRRENDNKLYDEQEKSLRLEIDTLKQKSLSP